MILSAALLCNANKAFAQAEVVTVIYTPVFIPSGYTITSSAVCSPCNPFTCSPQSQASDIATAFKNEVKNDAKDAAKAIERDIKDKQKDLLSDFLDDIAGMEVSISKSWNQAWIDMMKVALKEMTKQISVVMMEESRQVQSFYDATLNNEIQQEDDIFAAESEKEYRPSIHANIAAAAAKGYGRANLFSRVMRQAVPQEVLSVALNKKGAEEKSSKHKYEEYMYNLYMSKFCDPTSAGAAFSEQCTATNNKLYDADVQPNKLIYNRLTLPIDPNTDPDKDVYKALVALRLNMFGNPIGDIMSKDVLNGPDGREIFLKRRSYIARYGALMSAHNLIESWRAPGSQMGKWLKSLLEIKEGDIKDWYRNVDNPSYKEIIHAMSVDKFNSGRYARDLISNESDIKMEKLVLTAMQSILLRDYYELLERTALILAVQVSAMTDGVDETVGASSISTGGSGS